MNDLPWLTSKGILPISAFQVARITGASPQCTANFKFCFHLSELWSGNNTACLSHKEGLNACNMHLGVVGSVG
jgi:hypothetical protein